MKRVYRAASLLQVAHARNVLIAAGVECELRNIYLAGALGELPMMETWPQLYVNEADERYALSMLARAAQAPGGAAWVCEECRELLEPQFTSCWRCGPERDASARAGKGGYRPPACADVHRMCHSQNARHGAPRAARLSRRSRLYINQLRTVSDKHLHELAQNPKAGSARLPWPRFPAQVTNCPKCKCNDYTHAKSWRVSSHERRQFAP